MRKNMQESENKCQKKGPFISSDSDCYGYWEQESLCNGVRVQGPQAEGWTRVQGDHKPPESDSLFLWMHIFFFLKERNCQIAIVKFAKGFVKQKRLEALL